MVVINFFNSSRYFGRHFHTLSPGRLPQIFGVSIGICAYDCY